MPTIYHQGEFLPGDRPIFTAQNRGFKYGDGLFESMAMFGHRIPLLSSHLARLRKGMELLSMEANDQLNGAQLTQIAQQLAKRNGINAGNAYIRLCVYRLGDGKYKPISNKVGVLVEASHLPNNRFELNAQGLSIGIFEQIRCPAGYDLTAFKTFNKLQSVLAASYAHRHGWDECLLLNQHAYLAEAASSNVFLVENGSIITPHMASGGLQGVMHRQVTAAARKWKISLRQRKRVTLSQALAADEIWLTNAVKGIQWVKNFQNREDYKNELARQFLAWINEDLKLFS